VCACLPVFQFGINREDLSTGPLEFYLSVGVATLVGLCHGHSGLFSLTLAASP
jgi:hypothetical protein